MAGRGWNYHRRHKGQWRRLLVHRAYICLIVRVHRSRWASRIRGWRSRIRKVVRMFTQIKTRTTDPLFARMSEVLGCHNISSSNLRPPMSRGTSVLPQERQEIGGGAGGEICRVVFRLFAGGAWGLEVFFSSAELEVTGPGGLEN